MAPSTKNYTIPGGSWEQCRDRVRQLFQQISTLDIPEMETSAGGVLDKDEDPISDTFGQIILAYDTDQFEESPVGTLHIQHLDMSGSTVVFDEPVEIVSTTGPQFKISYDDSNYATFEISSGGDLTIIASGGAINLDGLKVKYTEDDVAGPPTDAQLDTAFGTPATLGAGYIGILDDNSADADVYICFTNDISWWHIKGIKAAVVSAIDSAEKRRSISGIPFLMPGVTPNIAKDQEWRQEAGWCYSGILVGA
jgi:hypothetical protein